MRDEVLELLSRELAQSTLFDAGVEAARNACVAGASLSSAVITAAAWYDNPLTGIPALSDCLARLEQLPADVSCWREAFRPRPHPHTQDAGYSPGFGFVAAEQAEAVLRSAQRLREQGTRGSSYGKLEFFLSWRPLIVEACGALNATGLAALVLCDRGYGRERAERFFMLRRVETALVEAQAARSAGVARFPFFSEQYVYEGKRPEPRRLNLEALLREVGVE